MTFSTIELLIIIFALLLFIVVEPIGLKCLNKVMFGGFHERWVLYDINRMIRELKRREEMDRIMSELDMQEKEQIDDFILTIKDFLNRKNNRYD